jgi:hypothetical protein
VNYQNASFGGRPTCRPRRRAAAMPTFVLSEITLRSNSAIALTIENTMRPAAVAALEWLHTGSNAGATSHD